MANSNTSSSSKSEFLVNGKYRLIRKIGSGSFGDIYLGINVSNGEVCQKGPDRFGTRPFRHMECTRSVPVRFGERVPYRPSSTKS